MSPLLGFRFLSNGNCVKATRNEIQIIDPTSANVITFDISMPETAEFYKFFVSELPNQRLAIVYSYYRTSFLMKIDLNHHRLDSTEINLNIKYFLTLPNEAMLFLSYTKLHLGVWDQTGFKLSLSYIVKRAALSLPVLIPEKESIILLSSNHNSENSPSVIKILNYALKEQQEFKLDVRRDIRGEVITLPGDRVAFISYKPNLPLNSMQFLCIYDFNRKRLRKVELKSAATIDQATYEKLFLLNETHIFICGLSSLNQNICIQGFDISNTHFKKIKEFMIKDYIGISPTPDGRLAACSSAGSVTLYHVLPQSDELKSVTTSTLIGQDQMLLPKDVIRIITDYAGFFTQSSKKSQQTQLFKEERIPDNPGKCTLL